MKEQLFTLKSCFFNHPSMAYYVYSFIFPFFPKNILYHKIWKYQINSRNIVHCFRWHYVIVRAIYDYHGVRNLQTLRRQSHRRIFVHPLEFGSGYPSSRAALSGTGDKRMWPSLVNMPRAAELPSPSLKLFPESREQHETGRCQGAS